MLSCSCTINSTYSWFGLISALSNCRWLLVNLSISLRSVCYISLNWLITYIPIRVNSLTRFLLISNTYISWSIFRLRCILKFRIVRSMIIINSRICCIMCSIKLSTSIIRLVMFRNIRVWLLNLLLMHWLLNLLLRHWLLNLLLRYWLLNILSFIICIYIIILNW